MPDITLVFQNETTRLAEIDRLARQLLGDVGAVTVISENRYAFDGEVESAVHQVRIELPAGHVQWSVTETVERWARDCIAERNLLGEP